MLEIERKFIVDTAKWQPTAKGEKIVQGYLSADKKRSIRVRIKGNEAFITIKGESKGIVRTELEYPIPFSDAPVLLEMCVDHPVEKTRYFERHFDKLWEIDVFEGVNRGLVVAEVELESEEEEIQIPDWVKEEVSHDARYFNACLAQHPFKDW